MSCLNSFCRMLCNKPNAAALYVDNQPKFWNFNNLDPKWDIKAYPMKAWLKSINKEGIEYDTLRHSEKDGMMTQVFFEDADIKEWSGEKLDTKGTYYIAVEPFKIPMGGKTLTEWTGIYSDKFGEPMVVHQELIKSFAVHRVDADPFAKSGLKSEYLPKALARLKVEADRLIRMSDN